MNTNFRRIRERLGLTQSAIGALLGVTQGSVSFYERGHTVPPRVAGHLIDVAARRGVKVSFDDIYATAPSAPKRRSKAAA